MSSPSALWPYSGPPPTFCGIARPLIGLSVPSTIAWLMAATAGKPWILLFIFAVGSAATPQRSTPASIRAVAPSLRLPAGIPTCAAAPTR